jgi:hypothetical protein
MKKNQISFIEKHIQGAIGKRFVIKHYKGGKVVKTKFPDMTNIKPSLKQKACRQRFADATVYATAIMHDEAQRTEWEQRTGKRKNILRGELISLHMEAAKQNELKARIASGKCITYNQVQILPFKSQPLTRGGSGSCRLVSPTYVETESSGRYYPAMKKPRKRSPLSKESSSTNKRPPKQTHTKRNTWIRTSKNSITFRLPVIKIPRVTKSISQLVLAIISLIPVVGGRT